MIGVVMTPMDLQGADPPMGEPEISSFLPLHPHTFRILVALREEERHGYAIVKELERDPEVVGRIMPANLYRRIRTLRDRGLIEESDERPDPELDDERRRYFRVTALGDEVARAEALRLKSLVERAGDLLT